MGRLIGKNRPQSLVLRAALARNMRKKLANEGANVIVTDILDPAEVVAEINAAVGWPCRWYDCGCNIR